MRVAQRALAFIKKIIALPWLPHALALAGGLAYLIHALYIAHTKTSFLDEGLYLYKGYLFVNGLQTPFADYGVWTNHAILSFLIPGYIQKLFGPGLETGRYFMIFLSLFILLGLWVFARRWGNPWWAGGIVWVMALNPAEIKVHTLVLSEGPIAAMLVWIVVLTVGERRPLWQILLGASLTAPLVLTRENMAFVPPILFLYIFWQHGWKAGLLAALCSGILFIGGNAFYFPDNLKFWSTRVPDFLAQFMRDSQMPSAGVEGSIPEPEESNLYRMILYFLLTFRLHFVALISAVTVWLLWPVQGILPFTERTRAAIFLSVLLVVLYVAHVQAAFFGEFCISCILLYVGYFDVLGLMLLVIAWPFLLKELTPLRRVIVFGVITLLLVGIGFSSHEDLSADFARVMIERMDKVYIWNALLFRTGLPHLLLFRTSFVLLASFLVLVIGGIGLWVAYRRLNGKQDAGRKIGVVALNSFLIAGLILTPTKILGGGSDFFGCDGSDVIASYERAGRELSTVIEPGSKIYWEGRLLAVFLYLPDVQIYPPQMNHVHSFYVGGDSDTLLRFSHWNEELARQWLEEADYILFQPEERIYLSDEILESGDYVKVMASPKAERCRWQSVINVYQRVER
jgi:hypothetical protein